MDEFAWIRAAARAMRKTEGSRSGGRGAEAAKGLGGEKRTSSTAKQEKTCRMKWSNTVAREDGGTGKHL